MLTERNVDACGAPRLAELTFTELQNRLIDRVRADVDRGRFSTAGLSRLTGLSQPTVWNVLERKRGMTASTADKLLQAERMSVYDLLDLREVVAAEEHRSGALTLRACGPCVRKRAPLTSLSAWVDPARPRPTVLASEL
jgi:hypothetical protein